jgi:hypothetical protein
MTTSNTKFVTAINCIDGRIQEPIAKYLKKNFHADFVDDITHPGIDKFFLESHSTIVKEIQKEVRVSVNAHGSKVIAISAHHSCAANPISREEHIKEIKKAIEVIRNWNLDIKEILGFYVNEKWEVEKVV